MKNYSSQIMRAVRKYHQLMQKELGPLIGTTQSAISKIEAGTLELSASQWIEICQRFNLDPRCLLTGKIENFADKKIEVADHLSIGGYDIPKEYGHLMGSTVRTAYPLIKFMRIRLGEKRSEAFLNSTGFDLDYFVIMNNPLNLKFSEHIVMFLISEGCLTMKNIPSIIELGKFQDIHSSVMYELGSTNSIDVATRKLLTKVKATYELNTSYEFQGGKEYVVAKDNEFVKEFRLSPEFNEFRKIYNLSHFQGLDNLVCSGDHRFRSQSANNGWIIVKAS